MEAKDPYKFFIDTGGLIALLDETEPYHKESSLFYRYLKKNTLLFTSSLVISETYTWLHYHCGHTHATRFLSIVEKATKTGDIKSILPDADLINKTHAVLRAYN